MFYILSYRVDKKTKTLKINEESAKKVREKLAAGDANQFISLGLETMRIGQISALSAQNTDSYKAGIEDLRKRLSVVALECWKCKGDGFLEKYFDYEGKEVEKWQPKCDVLKEVCECQGKVKESFGIEKDDFNWYHRDDEKEKV